MRHPPIARHRASPSLQPGSSQHIWISDDLVSRTVSQFFRSACPHQCRHSSSVPGPLEARRRANKRRMTAQAAFCPPPPPPPLSALFNVGALFGARSSREPSWKYEPPTLPSAIKPLGLQFPPLDSKASTLPSASSMLSSAPAPNATAPHHHTIPIPTLQSQDVSLGLIEGDRQFGGISANVPDVIHEVANPNQRAGHTKHETLSKQRASLGPKSPPRRNEKSMEDSVMRFKKQLSKGRNQPEARQRKILMEAFTDSYSINMHPDDQQGFINHVVDHLANVWWAADNLLAVVLEELLFDGRYNWPLLHTPEGLALMKNVDRLVRKSTEPFQINERLHKQFSAHLSPSKQERGSTQDSSLRIFIGMIWDSSIRSVGRLDSSHRSLLYGYADRLSSRQTVPHLDALLTQPIPATADYTASLLSTSKSKGNFPKLRASDFAFLPQSLLRIWTRAVPRAVLRSLPPNLSLSDSPVHIQCLKAWVNVLTKFDAEFSDGVGTIPGLCAETCAELAVLDMHLSFTSRPLREQGVQAMVFLILSRVAHHRSLEGISKRHLQRVFQDYRTSVAGMHKWGKDLDLRLIELMKFMKEKGLPNHGVAELSVRLIHKRHGLGAVLKFLRRLHQGGVKSSDVAFLKTFMHQTIEHTRSSAVTGLEAQHYAFAVHAFQEIRTFKLHDTVEMANVLSNQFLGHEHAHRQFQHILDRAKAEHALPLPYRNLTADTTMNNRVKLIHQLAHQYSLDNTRSFRENWRSIYFLYKYLYENCLPVGPLFTRALVKVCIDQPLSQKYFVSSRRLIWLCKLISKTDGVDAARAVEHKFWVQRGQLIEFALKRYRDAGGMGKVHVSTVRRLGLLD
ncbi:hypothetical protein BS50DRAFT_124847 [Corynespora cassiicola Philippines]|uniref:Uncharacterized protein n=1 Tax=Corynespora cassiicola Philippines TaxID=1448308 RepID=A0A2T2NB88_CORCC|nr:hypothetical protein BS50DRAFT_124847 [Corynespora cassiicola Philippines]